MLEQILAGTASESGERFFATLVKSLAQALDVHGAWVTEYLREARRLRAHAFWLGGQWVADFEYDLQDTPCAPVVEDPRIFYRLHVFPITLPPLRQRGDDVLLLATAFVERYAQRIGRPVGSLSAECKRRLKGYAWPGNVRELQNVIERAVITAKDGEIDLAQVLPEAAAVSPGGTSAAGSSAGTGVLTAAEVEAFERTNLLKALERTSWQVAGEDGAAQLLGMKPSTLASRMKALGLQRPEK